MASAAPAATAPSTGAPADGAQPTPVAAPSAQPAPAPAARIAKPIPSLPGVFPDEGDPFPAPPSSKSPSRGDSPAAGANRGPDGRFLAGASPATTDGEPARELGDGQPPVPPTPPAAKFKFGGEEFDTQEAAEQNFRSLRGQYRPVQSLARQLGGVEHIVPRFSEAAASARGWQAKSVALEAELAALRSGAPATTSQPVTPASTPTDADPATAEHVIDWDFYAEVRKLANERNEPWKAEQWLHEQTQKVVDSRLQRALAEKFAPLEAQQHEQAVAGQTEALFGSLATYVNGDGSPAFPELHDEDSAYEVGKMWATLGLPADFALTPQGAIAAIGIYRMAKHGSQARTTPTAAQPPTAPLAPPTANHDALAAATLSDGRPTRQATAADGSPSAEAAYIRAALRTVNASNRAVLGFDA